MTELVLSQADRAKLSGPERDMLAALEREVPDAWKVFYQIGKDGSYSGEIFRRNKPFATFEYREGKLTVE